MSYSPKQFKIILADIQHDLCIEWQKAFKEFDNIQIHHGYFQQVKEFDCMVSPANSFGMMDGGIDFAIRKFFGIKLEQEVQNRIQKDFFGEQPVGTSMIVLTEHEDHPFLAHTPTMRVPADISHTDNVYNAMFALLRAIATHNRNHSVKIQKVLCPGLGTATGRLKPREAARQMSLAYRNFMKPTTNMTWSNLMARNNEIMGKLFR